jgi:streptogramin lyase
MKMKHLLRWALPLGVAAVALTLLLMGLQDSRALAERNGPALSTPAPQSSFLYRFDSVSKTFFTLTLPTGSTPYGVAVTGTSPTHVWVPEYGVNQIGHLIYTDTDHYQWITYSVASTANSEPFRIAVNGNDVWFTERGVDQVGRLDATTGEVTEFYSHGLTSDAGLADLNLAPDGSVWMTGQQSNHLIQLVVTSTYDYAFREYDKNELNGKPIPAGPFGISVGPDPDFPTTYVVWFTAPASHTLARLTPGPYGEYIEPADFPSTTTPYDILLIPITGYAWYSDMQGNTLGQMSYRTLSNLVYYPITRPAQLASESPDVLWFTQQDERGQVGRIVYTSAVDYHLSSYPLPTSGLQPTGIAVASDKGVWFVAFAPYRVFLPMVVRN